jgi:hypothetical protein
MLLSAGVMKSVHWREFQGVVAGYRLLPRSWSAAAALLIAAAETLLGAALILGFAAPFAALGSAVLLLVFAAAMAINIRRGRTAIDCGCFQSALRQPLEWRLVVRNCVCASVAVAAAMVASSLDVLIWLQALLPGLVLFVLYLALNSVWALDASQRAILTRS